jgi:DNA-directed RNA polymerase subunit E'/Rpb7
MTGAMEIEKEIDVNFSIHLSELNTNSSAYIDSKCKTLLLNNIYNGFLVVDVIQCTPLKDKKINLNGTVNMNIKCKCNIVNPEIGETYEITINDVNKMGVSYKSNKICIFIPQHICTSDISLHDKVSVKIIGKRVEDSIICIAEIVDQTSGSSSSG